MRKSKILIIDDEVDFGYFVKANLEARGPLKVKTASSGEEGLLMAQRFKPDLILLDIIMPDMDGMEVLAQLKEMEKTMFIPVLMLTARQDDSTKVEASGLYCEGYMTKPIQIQDLQAKIEKILELRRLSA